MSIRRWQVDDFRGDRRLLEPEDFAIGGDNPPPTDRVNESVWRNLMSLPDDVAIRTTNHYGSVVADLSDLRWSFLDIVEQNHDRLGHVLLDVQEEFGAAIVFAVQGFYRQSAASLRTGFELSVIGAYCNASSTWAEFDRWEKGETELAFGSSADLFSRIPLVKALEAHIASRVNDSLFRQRTRTSPGGWSRRLYATLSNFAHSRPRYANADIWESNGPIYVPSAFINFGLLFTETYAFATLVIRLGRAGAQLPGGVPAACRHTSSPWAQVCYSAHDFLNAPPPSKRGGA